MLSYKSNMGRRLAGTPSGERAGWWLVWLPCYCQLTASLKHTCRERTRRYAIATPRREVFTVRDEAESEESTADPGYSALLSLPLAFRQKLLELSLATAASAFSFSTVCVVTPALAVELGVSSSSIGLLFSATSLTKVLLNIMLGKLADERRSRLPMIVGGQALVAAVHVVTSVAATFPGLLALRMVDGVGQSLQKAGSDAWTATFADARPLRRLQGSVFGVLAVAGSFGGMLGPVVAGRILQHHSTGEAMLTSAGVACLAVLLFTRLGVRAPYIPEPNEQSLGSSSLKSMLNSDLVRRDPLKLSAILNPALQAVNFSAEMVLIPALSAALGLCAADLGMLFGAKALVNLITGPIGGHLCDRHGFKTAFTVGLTLGGLGFGCITAAIHYGSPDIANFKPLMVASYFIWAVGFGLLQAPGAALTTHCAPRGLEGLWTSLIRQTYDVLALLTPAALGLAADHLGLAPAFGAVAAVTTLGGLALRRLLR